MKKLIEGIVDFRKNISKEQKELFAKLALGQKPDALFIACSDSRVVPNLFASTDPGDLFVVRNVGNLVSTDVGAALEFAIHVLGVSDIVVCGHSECGAMKALAEGGEATPHLTSWLKAGKGAVEMVKKGLAPDPSLSEVNQISQCNVLQQMEHIASHPCVGEGVRIHGWWFDIAHADVYCYEEDRFVLIDEVEAKRILKRLV